MNTRSLVSPSVFGFSLDTWALWILNSGFAQTLDHAMIITSSSSTSPSIFGRCAFSDLVSQIESTRCRLCSWYSGASSLASPTNRAKHRLSDTRLSPSIPGRQWHIRGGGFGHALFGQKKISHGHKKNGKTWFGPLLCESIIVARHEMAPATVPPHPEILYTPLPGALHLGSGFVHESRHAPIITPSAQASISQFFVIFDSILPTKILHFQLVVREQHHKSMAGPWFKKV